MKNQANFKHSKVRGVRVSYTRNRWAGVGCARDWGARVSFRRNWGTGAGCTRYWGVRPAVYFLHPIPQPRK